MLTSSQPCTVKNVQKLKLYFQITFWEACLLLLRVHMYYYKILENFWECGQRNLFKHNGGFHKGFSFPPHAHPIITQYSRPTQFSPDPVLAQYSPNPVLSRPIFHPLLTHFSPNRTQPNVRQNVHPILTQLCYHSCLIVTHSHPIEPTQFLTNAHPIITQYSHPTQCSPNPVLAHYSPNPFLTQSNPTQCSSKCSLDSHPITLSFLPNCHLFSPNRNQPNF